MTSFKVARPANSFVGSAVERIEDLRFLRGRGQYVDDVTRPGLLHAAILRSAVAHGKIRAIDTAAARALHGVHAVITAADMKGAVPTIPLRQEPLPAFKHYEQPVIAHGKVRYVGEPIAVVVADTQAHRRRRTGVDRGRYRSRCRRSPIAAHRAATRCCCSRPPAAISQPRSRPSKAMPKRLSRAPPYRRRERFQVQRFTAVPMESRGFLAEWDAGSGRLTLCGAAKVAFPNRRILAKQMGLPEGSIRMVENDVGGAFGVRGEFYPEDFLIPFAARLLERPVKWIEDRREHLTATNHARDVECELEIACERDGTILGLRGQAYADIGAYIRTNGATAARNVAQVMSGPYSIPNIHVAISLMVTNKTPVGTYRGPGRFEADFFRERLFDIVANDLGLDRTEFRRRNLISEAQMPYSLATVMPLDMATETDNGDYAVTLDRCLQEIGWTAKAGLRGKLVDGRYHGMAIGCYLEGGASGPTRERADADRRRRHHRRLRRLVRCRPGRRDRLCADRGRCARNADGAHQGGVPRLHRFPRTRASAPTARARW